MKGFSKWEKPIIFILDISNTENDKGSLDPDGGSGLTT
jgi:hypothetical protein